MAPANALPALKIGPFTASKPIVQGGMGVGISLSGLASAVANEGGIGVISSVGLGLVHQNMHLGYSEANCAGLRTEIARFRELSQGILGVNIMVALSDFEDQVDTAIEEEVDILFMGAGLPLRFSKNVTPEILQKGHTRFVPIVSSARALDIIFKHWHKRYQTIPDAVVLEGPLAGGHLGYAGDQLTASEQQLESLLPQVVAAARKWADEYNRPVPVIAAGGIYTGEDMAAMMAMGASGVQLGTRFVATHECDAHDNFKAAYLKAGKFDIRIIQSPVGLPGRAINNVFLEQVSQGHRHPVQCAWKCLKTCDYQKAPYCIAQALVQAQRGRIENGFVFAGANAWRVQKLISVRSLMEELTQTFLEAIAREVRAA